MSSGKRPFCLGIDVRINDLSPFRRQVIITTDCQLDHLEKIRNFNQEAYTFTQEKNVLSSKYVSWGLNEILGCCLVMSSNENISALLVFCAGNSPVTSEFPPTKASFDVFFDLRLIKWLGKQSRSRWCETPSRSLWRHCNACSLFRIHPLMCIQLYPITDTVPSSCNTGNCCKETEYWVYYETKN